MEKKIKPTFPDVIEIQVRDVGPVLLKRSIRAKHISISIQPFKGVRVTVPAGISFEKAIAFAETKIAWINKNLTKAKHHESAICDNSARFTGIDRNVAKGILVKRLNQLSEKYELPYNRVFIRNQKTRWASCSFKNNISLNIKLIMLADVLIDYVLLHELVHTRIKNHGNEFWGMLETLLSDARKINKKLKAYIF